MLAISTDTLKGYGLNRIFQIVKNAGFDGVDPFAGEVVAAGAVASTFGGSATGAVLVFGALGVFAVLAFGALVLGVFGLLDDLALDLLAF